ncbi:major facilitator superfamily transporter [Xylaria sp. FL1042]|nr:major facilitator superfamily transporter [Xylaria sp. FL1042]
MREVEAQTTVQTIDAPNGHALTDNSNANQHRAKYDTTLTDNLEISKSRVYHVGWRLHALTAGLCVSLLLSTLDTTIVSTSLVSIVNDLHGFDRSGWVVTSYLLTYTGFLIIYVKLSDILGCKLMLLCAITLFTVFSIACGVSNSMLLLIVLRAFPGAGTSGIYSLSTIIVTMMAPPCNVFDIRGVINDHTAWRWVFFLNGPGGVLVATLIAFSIPFGFPYGESNKFFKTMIAQKALKRIDVLGGLLSSAASILLVFALQQGGVAYPWDSSAIISVFVVSGLSWIGFILRERQLSLRAVVCEPEPMFPWRLTRNRFILGLLMTPIGAVLRLLPLLLLSPVASALSGFLISKAKVPPLYLLLIGGSLKTLGVGLFSSLDSSNLIIPSAQYGTILNMVPMIVNEKDMPVSFAWVTQIRVLGGTIGLAIGENLLSSSSIDSFAPEMQRQTRMVFAAAYSQQMRTMLYFSIASLFSLLLLVEKQPRRVVDLASGQISKFH